MKIHRVTAKSMTLEEFAKKTGWPIDELLDTPVPDFFEILTLMDMRLVFEPKKKPTRKKS